MATNTTNKAIEVKNWHDWCEKQGFPHFDSDARNYITRRWPALDQSIRDEIFQKSKDNQ